jgi:DNA polymerase-1
VDTALFYDNLSDRKREVLGAYKTIKEVTTRRNLFYKTWRVIAHWRDGRVHASLNQAEAATRRYSASSPNVQQMPSRGPGADFRRIVQPHHRKAVIVSCDFSGQELRGLAHQCKDEALTACYVGDNLLDVHSLTAVQASVYLWGELVAYDEFLKMLKSDDKEVAKRAKLLRSQAKTVVFASQYGAQAPNIAQQLFVDEETAQRFLDAKDKAFPRIEQWKKEVEDLAAQRGYALDLMGFRRHLAQALSSENKWEAAKAARQASNFAIQASAACQTLLAMSTMWRKGLFTGRYDAQFYFPIHDECVASVHKDQAVEFIREFHSCMTQPFAGMTIPIVSSIDIGRNFGDLIEIGDDFDEEKISKALDELFAA